MSGRVQAIYTAAQARAPLEPLARCSLEAGRGLVGDRYYLGTGTFSKKLAGKPDVEVTLVESEEIERFNREHDLSLGAGELRRNVVTTGIRLNDLVGLTFTIGEATLEGMRLCEPCPHLAKIVTREVLPGLIGRAGLRARVVTGGTIKSGDAISVA